MICSKPAKTFFYCHRCANNPANMPPTHHIRTLKMTYPKIEPVSGDCLDYKELTNDQTTAAADVYLRTGKLSCKDLKAIGIRKHIGNVERAAIEERATGMAINALRLIPARVQERVQVTDIENNPWHAYNHFVEAPYLGPSDRAAAETLWKRYRKLQKRAGRLEMIVGKSQERERLLLERLAELEAAMAALEKDGE